MGPGEFSAVIRCVIVGIFERRVDHLSSKRRVLRIEPHFLGVPDDDFVPGIPQKVQNFHTLCRMTVLREGNNLTAPAVDHAALRAVRVQQQQIPAVAGPVDRDDDIAVGAGLIAVENIAVAVIDEDDALTAPIVGDRGLVPWQIRPVIGGADTLSVTDALTDLDIALKVENHKAFLAADDTDIVLIRIRNQPAEDDFVRMILSRKRPDLFAVGIYQIVTDKHLIPPIAVDIGSIGEMSGDSVMVAPQGFQLVVVNIQAAVAVLDQDVRGSGVAREIADAHSVDIDMVKRVLPIGNATVECFQRLSGFRNWDACQFSAGCAFQNAQTKIHNGQQLHFYRRR